MAMKGVSIVGSVGVVIGGVAATDAENPSAASKLERDALVGIWNDTSFVIEKRNRDDHRILPVGMERGAIGHKLDARGFASRLHLIAGNDVPVRVTLR